MFPLQEYLEKYYGIVEKRDYPLSDADVTQHSDGVVDYAASTDRYVRRPARAVTRCVTGCQWVT